MRYLPLLTACLLGLVLMSRVLIAPMNNAAASEQSTNFLYTQAKTFNALAWLKGAERFPDGATLMVQDRNGRHPLVPGFAATADGDVSFDAKAVLFAGKQTADDPWQIYEWKLTGSSPRRVVTCAGDCVRPLYLPEGRMVFAEKVNGQLRLQTSNLDGTHVSTLSYAPGNFLPNDVLRDGRILFSAGFPLGNTEKAELYTVYSDGSGVEAYRCDHGKSRFSGTQLSDGDILFSRMAGATSRAGLARFTSARAEEVPVTVPLGDFAGGIAELEVGKLLLSSREHTDYSLKQWTIGGTALKTALAQTGSQLVEPVAFKARAVPNRHPSALHDWKTSNLLALNAAISRDGSIDARAIVKVRVTSLDPNGAPTILGLSDVEKDGSFFLQVPGDRPLRFELLDANGKVLRRQQGWMWARGGEQRICVGCHAGPERAPENAVPAVLLRSTEPTNLAGSVRDAATPGEH